jgi:hypothetical protein
LNAEFETDSRSATASPQALGVMMASQRSNSFANTWFLDRQCHCDGGRTLDDAGNAR